VPLKLGKMLEVRCVAEQPLSLLGSKLAVRKTFDAICRIAGVAPDILIESVAPSNVLRDHFIVCSNQPLQAPHRSADA